MLIPRPDSEFVGDGMPARWPKDMAAPRILDIGTGSGNLAVAIAHRHKGARVTAMDISPEALAVAAQNAAKHGVADRITFLEGDLFAPVPPGRVSISSSAIRRTSSATTLRSWPSACATTSRTWRWTAARMVTRSSIGSWPAPANSSSRAAI